MARLLLELRPEEDTEGPFFNNYYFLSALYSLMGEIGLTDVHRGNKFRYFTFSDFFPYGDAKKGDIKRIIVSSPDKRTVESISKEISSRGYIYLGEKRLSVSSSKFFEIRELVNEFITGSPVVIYKDNRKGLFFSLSNGDPLSFFLERIKENAVKKYKQFKTIEDFQLEGFIFDSLNFKKEVRVQIKKMGKEFYFVGTMWNSMKKLRIKSEYRDFYRFIMDAGIGEKNSMGFGFLNPKAV